MKIIICGAGRVGQGIARQTGLPFGLVTNLVGALVLGVTTLRRRTA